MAAAASAADFESSKAVRDDLVGVVELVRPGKHPCDDDSSNKC